MTQATSRPMDLHSVVDASSLLPHNRLHDYAIDGVTPRAVVAPKSVDELSDLLRVASEGRMRVVPWGGGSRMGLGRTPSAVDVVILTTSLGGLIAHEAADLTVSVQAGMTLDALQARLAKQGQYLPLQGPVPQRSTIGGILATATSGPWRLAYGGPRDWLIGSSVVLADGTQAKSGGQVVKNVTGYDLNKLYTGSLGTLGMIVGATFKISPLPVHTGTLSASFDSAQAALAASHQLLSLAYLPRALQLVTGQLDQWLPAVTQGHPERTFLLVEHAGGQQAVATKLSEARDLLAQDGAVSVHDLGGTDPWQPVADMGWVDPRPRDLLLRAVIQPSRLPSFVRSLHGAGGGTFRMAADPGYGLVRTLWPGEDGDIPDEEMIGLINALRSEAVSLGGHLVVERCPLEVKHRVDVWGEIEGAGLMRRIKQRLDPEGILNPGRFVAGI